MYNLQGQSGYRQQVESQQAKLTVEAQFGVSNYLVQGYRMVGMFTQKVSVP